MCSPSDDNPNFYKDLMVKSHDALLWMFHPSDRGASGCSSTPDQPVAPAGVSSQRQCQVIPS